VGNCLWPSILAEPLYLDHPSSCLTVVSESPSFCARALDRPKLARSSRASPDSSFRGLPGSQVGDVIFARVSPLPRHRIEYSRSGGQASTSVSIRPSRTTPRGTSALPCPLSLPKTVFFPHSRRRSRSMPWRFSAGTSMYLWERWCTHRVGHGARRAGHQDDAEH
jgi:hypothetical protein